MVVGKDNFQAGLLIIILKTYTFFIVQKIKFFIQGFFSKSEQIRSSLLICSHLQNNERTQELTASYHFQIPCKSHPF